MILSRGCRISPFPPSPNPENPEPKKFDEKYHFLRFSNFLIILFRIFRENDYLELVQGMRNKVELAALDAALARWKARREAINREISEHAVLLVRRYFLSHSLRVADALIAATALESNRPLITANDKHYRMIDGLDLVIFRPRQ